MNKSFLVYFFLPFIMLSCISCSSKRCVPENYRAITDEEEIEVFSNYKNGQQGVYNYYPSLFYDLCLNTQNVYIVDFLEAQQNEYILGYTPKSKYDLIYTNRNNEMLDMGTLVFENIINGCATFLYGNENVWYACSDVTNMKREINVDGKKFILDLVLRKKQCNFIFDIGLNKEINQKVTYYIREQYSYFDGSIELTKNISNEEIFKSYAGNQFILNEEIRINRTGKFLMYSDGFKMSKRIYCLDELEDNNCVYPIVDENSLELIKTNGKVGFINSDMKEMIYDLDKINSDQCMLIYEKYMVLYRKINQIF